MSVSNRHILRQGPVIASLLRAVASGAFASKGGPPEVPGKERIAHDAPRARDLLDDFIRHVGGNPADWAGEVPPHLFPQWAFPLTSRCLSGLPYPMARVVNAGCSLRVNGRLPDDEPLVSTARLASLEDDGRKALITTRLTTGTATSPEAIVAELNAYVPLAKGGGKKGEKKLPPSVPKGARELTRWRLAPTAGLDFAKLTGDFNPIHWIPAYAKSAGFKSTILHGFGTFSRAWQGLAEAGERPPYLQARFTRPLVLPADVGLFVDDEGGVFVGDHPGGRAYMVGSTRPTPEE